MGSLLWICDQPVHLERLAGGLAGELVSAVAGADGDGQRVQSGGLHELHGLVRIGQVAEAIEARAVPVFDAAQAADLAFHRDALGMRQAHHFAGGLDVIFEARGRLAVRHQRAIHHHAGETHVDGRLAGLDAVAVIQVQNRGDLGIDLGGRQHQVIQEAILRIGARPAARLHDHRRLGLASGLHDRLDLFHVVDVESAHAVTALGGLIQKLAHRN